MKRLVLLPIAQAKSNNNRNTTKQTQEQCCYGNLHVGQQMLMQDWPAASDHRQPIRPKYCRAHAYISIVLTADLAQLIHKLPPLPRPMHTSTHDATKPSALTLG